MSFEDAAKEVLNFSESNPTNRIYEPKGILVPAKLARDLILFGKDGRIL
jgi:hypothetical protein